MLCLILLLSREYIIICDLPLLYRLVCSSASLFWRSSPPERAHFPCLSPLRVGLFRVTFLVSLAWSCCHHSHFTFSYVWETLFFFVMLKKITPLVSCLLKGKWMQLNGCYWEIFCVKIWFVFSFCSIFATANEKRTASKKSWPERGWLRKGVKTLAKTI